MNAPRFLYESISLPPGVEFALRRNAEPPGQRSELHYHDHYELIFCLTGQLLYRVEGSIPLLRPGTVLLVHPYQFHQSVATGESAERIVLRFCFSAFPGNREVVARTFLEHIEKLENFLVLSEDTKTVIHRVLNDMLREKAESGFGWEQTEDSLLTQLIIYLCRAAMLLPAQQKQTKQTEEQLVQRVIEYMEKHLAEGLSVQELAEQFYVDRHHLSRSFSSQVGCPPHRYLVCKRLQYAAQLIQNGTPVSQIPAFCGFEDYSNFYRRFRAYYGMSPKQWQRKRLADNP